MGNQSGYSDGGSVVYVFFHVHRLAEKRHFMKGWNLSWLGASIYPKAGFSVKLQRCWSARIRQGLERIEDT